jgi:cellulose synthase/poly-beta-1,6-N-acetylglucosamine synthase-like glycosyltransferase
MLTFVVWFVAVCALPLLLPVAALVVEVLAALLPVRKSAESKNPRPRCAILVPAHDEEGGIERTLASITPELATGDRLVVVADNCTDRTAEVARTAGAEVVERRDTIRRGKGYALDCGIRFLESDPPAVVVIMDADCEAAAGAVDRLVRTTAARIRPVQAAYEMKAPAGGNARARLSAWLFRFKNYVRPRGLARIGLPCLLTGTGMAFPWQLIRNAPLASGNIVEDMQLGIDLAIAGSPPVFCPDARVTSELPAAEQASASQRTRWIHGHLKTLVTQVPHLLIESVRQRRVALAALAAELAVPPLSLLIMMLGFVSALLAGGWCLGGPALPAAWAVVCSTIALAALLVAWIRFGRDQLPARALAAIPCELLARLAILCRFAVDRQTAWIRTERRPSH